MNEAHFIINCTEGKGVVVPHFPCEACGRKVRTKQAATRVYAVPVHHSFQTGKCPGCLAQYFVANARTKADCVALEPLMQGMVKGYQDGEHMQMHGSSFDDDESDNRIKR